MEQKKNKISIGSILLLVVGVGLILFGIIFPQVRYSKKDSFTYEKKQNLATREVEYEIAINTDLSLNTNSAYMILNGKKFNLRFEGYEDEEVVTGAGSTTIRSGERKYVFTRTLEGMEYFSDINIELEVYCSSSSGKVVEFNNIEGAEDYKTIATVMPIFFGGAILLGALGSIWGEKKAKETKGAFSRALYGDGETSVGILGTVEEKIRGPKKPENKICEYCGSENKPDQLKCTECRAPLKRSGKN